MTKWDKDRSCDDSFWIGIDSPNDSSDQNQNTENILPVVF